MMTRPCWTPCCRCLTPLLVAVSVAAAGCRGAGGGRPSERSERQAVALAEDLLRRGAPHVTYGRICSTRLRDGYLFSYQMMRTSADSNVEYMDIDPMPIVVVPDSGVPRAVEPIADGAVWLKGAGGVPGERAIDSVTAVSLASEVAAPGSVLHCYRAVATSPRTTGAFVTFLAPGSSSSAVPIGGSVVAVTPERERGISWRF